MTSDGPAVSEDRLNALVDAALAVHGAQLDEAQRRILREHAERLRSVVEQLDQFRLMNADEPDFSFQAIDRVDAV
jgi:DICT domain-containing protein